MSWLGGRQGPAALAWILNDTANGEFEIQAKQYGGCYVR
jgi:hypothetical protein